jgi:uncharacterized protein
MIRLLLLILAIWIAFMLIRDALRRRRTRIAPRPATPVTAVQCARCGVHLPAERALQHVDGRHYCSPEHARDDG